jgi:hypothetical protein
MDIMTTINRRLSIGTALALALTAGLAYGADLTPAVATNLSGRLHIQQGIPCDDDVDQFTDVTGGRIEIVPAEGVTAGGNRIFALSRVDVTFAPFSVHRSCLTVSETRDYTAVAVQLTRAATFTGVPTAPGVFNITIPKDSLLLFNAAIVNGSPTKAFQRPAQDVTGTIDLNTGGITLHVVVNQTIHFEAGCSFLGCIVKADKDGTLTADINGTLAFPDADHDGVPDRSDNCRFVANADQSPVPTPAITAPPPITIASCLDHGIGIPNAADVCDAGPVGVANNAPAVFTSGATVVTWTATDAKNRSASANQTVTVDDKTPPTFTFVPLDLSRNDCGPVDLGQATATDDCAGTPAITNDSPGYFYVGTTVVTWKATDLSGNLATATQKVTVVDTVPPTVTCTPANPLGTAFVVTGFDACGAPVLTLGSYVIANGEPIKIEEVGQPGVRLQNVVSKDGIRKFFVGKGDGVILATDGSGNTSTVACVYPK